MCGVLSAVDMTFTPMNVLRAVREVKYTDDLGICLGVPWSKQDERLLEAVCRREGLT